MHVKFVHRSYPGDSARKGTDINFVKVSLFGSSFIAVIRIFVARTVFYFLVKLRFVLLCVVCIEIECKK